MQSRKTQIAGADFDVSADLKQSQVGQAGLPKERDLEQRGESEHRKRRGH
ncbi:hypothetical protein J2Y48_003957 [Mycoplana sp. BE70]|nr:hypothetical protein [Mycoplana sp. BE70]MDR6758649.1 hypothetical protein [Mycoplana sp. BE70]